MRYTLLRKDLSPSNYVTSQQIRSLFSRWSKQYREGTLVQPTAEDTQPDSADQNLNVNPEDFDVDDGAEQYQENLRDLALTIINPWQIDDWVAVSFNGAFYPGVVTKIDDEGTWVDCMKPVVPGKNCFRWPNKKDNIPYQEDEILCHIQYHPTPESNRGDVKLSDEDFQDATEKLLALA